MKKLCSFILILALLLAGFAGAQAQSVSGQIRVADFSLPVYGGGSAGPSDYLGKPLILLYGRADRFRSLMNGLVSRKKDLQAAGIEVLACVDLVDEAGRDMTPAFKKLYAKNKWKAYRFAMESGDGAGNLAANLRAVGLDADGARQPVAFLVDKDGYIRGYFNGLEKVADEFMQAALGISDAVSVSIGFSEKLLKVGKTLKLKPTVNPAAAKKYVRYTSSNPAVVRVSSSGKLKAVGKGSAVITAEVGGKRASCTIATDVPLQSVTLNAQELSMITGESHALKVAAYNPTNTTSKKKRQWSSSAPSVASVSSSGVVKAIAPGEAVIRCTVDGIEAQCAVRVLSKVEMYAAEVLRLVNVEREKAGLATLLSHESIKASANVRAQEIVTHFSHTRPDGSGCGTALTIATSYWGENIAMGQKNASAVMKAWMNSPGHRANILNARYTHLGVGAYESNGVLYWVQMFVGLR